MGHAITGIGEKIRPKERVAEVAAKRIAAAAADLSGLGLVFKQEAEILDDEGFLEEVECRGLRNLGQTEEIRVRESMELFVV